MAETGIMAGICTSQYPSPSPIEKIEDSPYPYPVNAGILHQNEDEFRQYPRRRVYLPSRIITHPNSEKETSLLLLNVLRMILNMNKWKQFRMCLLLGVLCKSFKRL